MKSVKKAETIKNGTAVVFVKYTGDAGELKEGTALTITSFDSRKGLYDVVSEDGIVDSLFVDEFEVVGAEKAEKPKTKVVKTEALKKAEAAKAKAAKTEAPKAAKPEKINGSHVDKSPVVEKPAKAAKEAPVKAAKVEKPAKAEKPTLELPALVKTKGVTAAIKAAAGSDLGAAIALANEKERTIFILGGVLAVIKRNGSFQALKNSGGKEFYEAGLKGFNLYVEEELGIKARMADYYVSMYEVFSPLATEEQIGKIGWSKLRELLPLRKLLTADNIEELLDYTRENPVKAVQEKVTKMLKDNPGAAHGLAGQGTKMVTYKLSVFDDQATVVQEAFDLARNTIGSEATEAECFVHILTQWSLSQAN